MIKVLIVDDSSLVRQILAEGLAQDPGIHVVGTAPDPYAARDKIVALRPDVITLDVEMPKMDGVAFLRRLMPQYPLPVIMVSALTQKGKQITMEALEAGAVDFVAKPSADLVRGLQDMLLELRTKIKIASSTNVAHWKTRRQILPSQRVLSPPGALAESTDKVIAIGASTGGTEAIRRIITRFPANMPGVVIVQHMPPGFTKTFADRLNEQCDMLVKEAESGDRILAGHALIAPGHQHMRVVRSGGIYRVHCEEGEKVCGHCPSVEVLMRSVADQAGANGLGVILTGMGNDGARGMAALHRAGAKTLGQDKETSVVFGMPCEAYKLGGVEKLLPLDEIAPAILKLLI